jgi:hypothetical protein
VGKGTIKQAKKQKENRFSFCFKTITYCANNCLAIFAITASDDECVVKMAIMA